MEVEGVVGFLEYKDTRPGRLRLVTASCISGSRYEIVLEAAEDRKGMNEKDDDGFATVTMEELAPMDL